MAKETEEIAGALSELSPDEQGIATEIGFNPEPKAEPQAETIPPAEVKKPDTQADVSAPESEKKPENATPEPTPEEETEILIPAGTADEVKRAISGLRKEVVKERGKRHTSESKVTDLMTQISYLMGQVDTLNKRGQKETEPDANDNLANDANDDDPLAGREDTDIMTVADVRAYEKSRDNKRKASEAKTKLDNRQTFLTDCENRAKAEYSEVKAGKGLHWDAVWAKAKEMIEHNPTIKRIVFASDDPAEAAYSYGLTHPDIRKLLAGKGVGEVVAQLNQPRPTTIKAGGPGGGVARLRDLSPDQLADVKDPKTIEAEIEALEKEESLT